MDNGFVKYALDTSVIIGYRFGIISEILPRCIVVTAALLVVALANRRGEMHRSLLVNISDKAAFPAAVRAVNLAAVTVLFQMKTVLTHSPAVLSVAHCTFAL